MIRPAMLLLVCAVLAACSTADTQHTVNAVATPLSDLNLMKTQVPEVLRAAQAAPYRVPAPMDCDALATEVLSLDNVLGPDLDANVSPEHRGLLARGLDEAHDAAAGALQRTAEGVVPFRGWIRKLSGAERHAREVQAAIVAGGLRRAYLKGLRQATQCPA